MVWVALLYTGENGGVAAAGVEDRAVDVQDVQLEACSAGFAALSLELGFEQMQHRY